MRRVHLGTAPRTMSTFALAADPIRPWDVLLSPDAEHRVQTRDDTRVVLGSTVDGLPATI